MRFYILLIIAFTIATSVNASITEKRELSAGFKVCSNDIATLTKRTATITKTVNKAQELGPIKNILTVVSGKGQLFYVLSKANTNCCNSFAPVMNSEDANAIVASLSPFVDEYANVVAAFVSKKPMIEKDETIFISTAKVLGDFTLSINILLNCLTSKPPANRTPAETVLFDKLSKAYSNAKTAYGI